MSQIQNASCVPPNQSQARSQPQSDAPLVGRQFTRGFLSIAGSLPAKQLMANGLALHISRIWKC